MTIGYKMKTKEQIKTDLEEIFECCNPDIEIHDWGSVRDGKSVTGLRIVISEMYRKPILKSFDDNLLKFLTLMQTTIGYDNLDLYEEISSSGCETCDYGSKYGWEFVVWN